MIRSIFGIAFWFLLTYLVIGLVVPSMSLWANFVDIFAPLYVDVPLWIFNTITGWSEYFQTMDNTNFNPGQDFGMLFGVAATIGLSLFLPVVWWVYISITIWFVLIYPSKRWTSVSFEIFKDYLNDPNRGILDENDWHIIQGRTTIQDTFDAEVQANAIAKALKDK